MSLTLRLRLIVSDTYCYTYVSHPPKEMQETWRPERPRKRYSIFGRSLGASDGEDMADARCITVCYGRWLFVVSRESEANTCMQDAQRSDTDKKWEG